MRNENLCDIKRISQLINRIDNCTRYVVLDIIGWHYANKMNANLVNATGQI